MSSGAPNYLEFKKVSAYAINDCCPDPRRLMVYLTEEANVDLHLTDKNKMPSYEWGETFVTLVGNTVRIYTDEKFEISSASLMYYRMPVFIEIARCTNPYTGVPSAGNVDPEFKDDIVELLIDEAIGIIAGDIESMSQYQRAQQEVEKNN